MYMVVCTGYASYSDKNGDANEIAHDMTYVFDCLLLPYCCRGDDRRVVEQEDLGNEQ